MLPLTLTIKIKDTNFIDRYDKAVRILAQRTQDILVDSIKQEIENRNLKAEGDLLDSIEARMLDLSADPFVITAGTDDIAAAALEYGTKQSSVQDKRGRPIVNIANIERWMDAKGITPEFGSSHQMAYAIALRIGKHGLPLHGGLQRPFSNAQKRAKRKIDRMWQDELSQLLAAT